MTSNYDKKSDISDNKLLKGLSNKELFELSTVGKKKQYNPGEILFKEGESDQMLFLILQGSIKLTRELHGQETDIETLQENDGLGNTSFIKDSSRTVSAIALKPSTIMIIDKLRMNMLTPEIQLCIYRNLNKIASENIDNLTYQDAKLVNKNKFLGSKIKTLIHPKIEEYAQTELIQNILENIPSLPMYTSNLVMLLQEENVSIREVVDQAKMDPSLVGVILKTVNSAYYSLKIKISDAQHAITYLGFNQVYQLVIDHGVKSTMPDTSEFQELQCHSNIVSIISFELAKLCNKQKPVMLGTIGLLHDVGNSVILLLKRQHQKLTMLIDLLDYACIGSLLLNKWNVPDNVYKSIEYQRFPEFFPPTEIPDEFRENSAILYIAHICYEYSKGKREEELPLAFVDEYIKLLGFSEMSLSQLLKNHIMPALYKKSNSYPENVRKFLMESKMTDATSTLGEDINIGKII
jgi:HD-like signal output (HDOD) protein